jgi:putative membrane protein
MSYLQRLVVNTLAFISLSVLFPTKFYVSSFVIAIIASVVLSILNMIVKPILHFFSLPITLITFL